MIRTFWIKVIYLVILTAAALFSVLYLGPFSVILLILLITVPVLMFLCLVYIRFNLKVSVQNTSNAYRRGMPQNIRLVVKNTGFLPVSRAATSIKCICHMTNTEVPVTLTFPIAARNTTTAEFSVFIPHCGRTSVSIKKLVFTDYIHLFNMRCRSDSQAELLVLPAAVDIDFPISLPGSETDEESSLYSKLKAGDDPSEVYRIREYQPGDLQKRIHWKLSCRTDTVWVKEYSFPIQHRAAVILDYSYPDDNSLNALDNALEAAFALSCAFVRQEVPLKIYWMNSQSGKLLWNEVNSETELNDCFSEILYYKPSAETEDTVRQLLEISSVRSTNAVYYFTPVLNKNNINMLSADLKSSRLHVLTSSSLSANVGDDVHVLHIDEKNICQVLKNFSAPREVNEK